MKRILFLFFLISPAIVFSQKGTLYNKDGITLTYSQTTSKSVFCKKDNKNTYYIRIRYTITNNSNQKAKVTSSVFTPHQPYAGLIRSTCSSQDEIWNSTEITNTSTEAILSSGDQEFMETVAWYYTTDVGTPVYNINYEFGKASTSNNNSPASSNQSKTNSTNNQNSGFSVNQAPPRVNPGKTTEETKQQAEDEETERRLKAWQEQEKRKQENLKRQNDAANNARKIQLEKQREIERMRSEQNEALTKKVERERQISQSRQEAISNAISEVGDIIQKAKNDAETQREERKRQIEYEMEKSQPKTPAANRFVASNNTFSSGDFYLNLHTQKDEQGRQGITLSITGNEYYEFDFVMFEYQYYEMLIVYQLDKGKIYYGQGRLKEGKNFLHELPINSSKVLLCFSGSGIRYEDDEIDPEMKASSPHLLWLDFDKQKAYEKKEMLGNLNNNGFNEIYKLTEKQVDQVFVFFKKYKGDGSEGTIIVNEVMSRSN